MNKKVLSLAIPSILANITVPLVGMADLAIAGRLGDAATIGGIAIATMLFDLLYWNMGFLRVGTGGIAAQAYGRGDNRAAMTVLTRASGTALASALVILALQLLFVNTAFVFIECTPEVENLAREYFFIRIWAAPATLMLFVFKGWFIGMQNTVAPMIVDVLVNGLNIGLSLFLALYAGMGFSGIALGTALAQYAGLVTATAILTYKYRALLKYIKVAEALNIKEMKSFFVLNGNLFLRSSALLLIYTGFTSISARYGDNILAINTIMMKLMLLFSYFIDGFAYAGEALTGRFIGAGDRTSLKQCIKVLFTWCFIIGVASTFLYGFGGEYLFRIMTTNPDVISGADRFMPWLLIMPVASCVAFIWDGIYIGATASAAIRNTMLASAAAFFIIYYSLEWKFGVQALWAGFFIHLIVRSLLMTGWAKQEIYSKA